MTISTKVARVLAAEHISDDELALMIKRAALLRSDDCNRRYFQWAFRVQNGAVEDMRHVTLIQVGQGRTRMIEDHDPCNGEGCHACGWAGVISRGIEDATANSLHP